LVFKNEKLNKDMILSLGTEIKDVEGNKGIIE
jgi:hypothetical protein